jgi:hypothetical protein
MTCEQLGGACDTEFHAETFEGMAKQSQAHGREMMAAQEPAHLAAMSEMGKTMADPEAMQKWMAEREAAFNALPEQA